VRLSKDARAQAAAAAAAVKAGRMTDAGAAFDKMGATCNACHDLHLEKK
jgi:cytochrome c556